MSWRTSWLLILFVLLAHPAVSGVYSGTTDCVNVPAADNFCGQGMTTSAMGITPFGITHSFGYAGGSPGTINLDVCVDSQFPELIRPAEWALAIWDALIAETGQCPGDCATAEEGTSQPDTEPLHAGSIILHELGHCAFGLGHPNLEFDPPGGADQREVTSFTMSYGGSSIGILEGPDGVRLTMYNRLQVE